MVTLRPCLLRLSQWTANPPIWPFRHCCFAPNYLPHQSFRSLPNHWHFHSHWQSCAQVWSNTQNWPSPPSPTSPPSIGTIEIDSAIYNNISILWTSNGFVGCCTNTYHVHPHSAPPPLNNQELDEYNFVVKDALLEKDLVNHECSILKHIASIKGVPTIIKAWKVQFGGQDDTTLRHRPGEWDPTLTPHYVTHVHWRLLMMPVGSPLTSFRSQSELLHGLIAGLESMPVFQHIMH